MISIDRTKQIIENEEEGPTLDYKEDLPLETDADRAKFVKDVISLANSGQTAHIITGVEDGTRKLVGIKTHHTVERLNQILRDKSDPPLCTEYVERNIMGYTIGAIEIAGGNPPYIVAVPDRYGGYLSSDHQKSFYIERGTVFVRNYNINEGARRADLDKMYKVKYVTLEPDLRIRHEASSKPIGDLVEVEIKFVLINLGEVLATFPYVWIQFKDAEGIIRCTGRWVDISKFNNSIPTIQLLSNIPACPRINLYCHGAIVRVNKDIKQIEAYVKMGAAGMRIKEGTYVISLRE